jgi:hypothetical protein
MGNHLLKTFLSLNLGNKAFSLLLIDFELQKNIGVKMSKNLIVFTGLLMLSQISFGQMSSNTSQPQAIKKAVAANGFRVSLTKSDLSMKEKGSTETFRLENTAGLSLGYVYLPVGSIGFTSNFSANEVSDPAGISKTLLRVDGNIAFAFNEIVNLKAGLNTINIKLSGDYRNSYQLGSQAGIGFQLSRDLGVDVNFYEMIYKGIETERIRGFYGENIEVNTERKGKISGAELAVHATF